MLATRAGDRSLALVNAYTKCVNLCIRLSHAAAHGKTASAYDELLEFGCIEAMYLANGNPINVYDYFHQYWSKIYLPMLIQACPVATASLDGNFFLAVLDQVILTFIEVVLSNNRRRALYACYVLQTHPEEAARILELDKTDATLHK